VSRKGKRTAPPVRAFLTQDLGTYDVTVFPEDRLYRDKVASVLGSAMDGWIPELVYRFAILAPVALNVDWAIMMYARRADEGSSATRRRVERIDICDSEVHIHRFRLSDNPDDDQGERKKVASLYTGDEVTVSRHWDLQMALLSREWESRMRRWIDG
jgi:hypothetical protein